jgi:hypothetical protein
MHKSRPFDTHAHTVLTHTHTHTHNLPRAHKQVPGDNGRHRARAIRARGDVRLRRHRGLSSGWQRGYGAEL